jgi:hypothetical protein
VFEVPTADTLILLPADGAAAVQGQGPKATSGFGIAGLVLGLLACPTAWIPLVGFLTIPISVLGLVLAGVGIVVSAIGKRTRLEMPIAAAVVSFVALLLALWPVIVVGTMVAPVVKEAVEDAQKQAKNEPRADYFGGKFVESPVAPSPQPSPPTRQEGASVLSVLNLWV